MDELSWICQLVILDAKTKQSSPPVSLQTCGQGTAELLDSLTAYRSEVGFEKRCSDWFEKGTCTQFDVESRRFESGKVKTLEGFDTFWYTWSLSNPDTTLLEV